MKTFIIIIITMILAVGWCVAQDRDSIPPPDRDGLLNLYLECDDCDMDYFRTSFTEVNYMAGPFPADVHIQVTRMTNGSGGSEYTAIYTGLNEFQGQNDTTVFNVPGMATADETRETMLNYLQLHLVPYLLKTPSRDRLMLLTAESPQVNSSADPWKGWMFELAGAGSFLEQKTYTDLSLQATLLISKVTPKIKIESYNYLLYNQYEVREYSDEQLTDKYGNILRNIYSKNLVVRSLGKRWGIGLMGTFTKSDYSNVDRQYAAGPALEYNVFDYALASRKQLLLQYFVYYQHSSYKIKSLYGKMQDNFIRQEVGVKYAQLERWGDVSVSAWAKGCYTDRLHYSTGGQLQLSVRPFQGTRGLSGLSLDISGGVAWSKDQLSLRGEADTGNEEFFWEQEMEKGLQYSIGIGISYRFGSTKNNTVNPRFNF